MSTNLKTKPCGACQGTGTLPANGVGKVLRAQRERAGVSGKDLATAMNLSDTYIYDLERGSRAWTNELVASYQAKLESLREHA